MPRWTPESREKQRQLISRWSPWTKSTGPRTDAGKERSRRNADKGGRRRTMRELARMLRELKRGL